MFIKPYMEKIYHLYYRIDTTLNDTESALAHYTLAKQWEDSILNQQNRRQWVMMQGEYETERAENKITMLESENEVKDLRIQQSRTFIFGLSGFVVIIVLMALLFIRQNKAKAEHKSVVLEQKLLRVQMNPHFIFNSLTDLQSYIWSKDPVKANDYLASFSKLLRLILENSRREFVPVEKEIDAITHYLKLQSFRYKDKFSYTIDIDEKIDEEHMMIPPMLAQPYIENSIEHGILAKETQGHIDVKFSLEGDLIHIEVTDDGIGFIRSSELKKDKSHESLAMMITQERLLMIFKKYRQKISFSISDILDDKNNVTGARVSFAVPYSKL
jgi:LytS/YehU family sensor histidine kinase